MLENKLYSIVRLLFHADLIWTIFSHLFLSLFIKITIYCIYLNLILFTLLLSFFFSFVIEWFWVWFHMHSMGMCLISWPGKCRSHPTVDIIFIHHLFNFINITSIRTICFLLVCQELSVCSILGCLTLRRLHSINWPVHLMKNSIINPSGSWNV